jgi:hypothetical protein
VDGGNHETWRSAAGCFASRGVLRDDVAAEALVAGVKKAGISPLKFAGGHGSTGDYAPLVALEGK